MNQALQGNLRGKMNPETLVNQTELQYALTKAKEITEQYTLSHIGSDDTERSVDNLLATCKSYLEKEIGLLELEITKEESPVWGACIDRGDIYDICYVQNLNYCWKRFVICKELFHVVLSKDEYRNMSLHSHVDEVTIAFPDDNSKPSLPVMAEFLAGVAAMEFLFPYTARKAAIETDQSNLNCRSMAERYKVPLVLIEKYISPSYMKVLSAHMD